MENLVSMCVKSACEMLDQMAQVKVESNEYVDEQGNFASLGVTSVVGFVGKGKGRLVLDLSANGALTLAERILGVKYESAAEEMVLLAVSELNNTISGDFTTKLNNARGLGLRLTPPLVFAGSSCDITIAQMPSQSVLLQSELGSIRVHLAFDGGLV